MKNTLCKTCPLSFVCLMEHGISEIYWCNTCKGWWLAECNLLVRCARFIRDKDTSLYEADFNSRRYACIAKMGHGRYDTVKLYDMIKNCPNCDPRGEDIHVIEGYKENEIYK